MSSSDKADKKNKEKKTRCSVEDPTYAFDESVIRESHLQISINKHLIKKTHPRHAARSPLAQTTIDFSSSSSRLPRSVRCIPQAIRAAVNRILSANKDEALSLMPSIFSGQDISLMSDSFVSLDQTMNRHPILVAIDRLRRSCENGGGTSGDSTEMINFVGIKTATTVGSRSHRSRQILLSIIGSGSSSHGKCHVESEREFRRRPRIWTRLLARPAFVLRRIWAYPGKSN